VPGVRGRTCPVPANDTSIKGIPAKENDMVDYMLVGRFKYQRDKVEIKKFEENMEHL